MMKAHNWQPGAGAGGQRKKQDKAALSTGNTSLLLLCKAQIKHNKGSEDTSEYKVIWLSHAAKSRLKIDIHSPIRTFIRSYIITSCVSSPWTLLL